MATRTVGGEVVGLREFMSELRKTPERLDLEIRKGFRGIAATVREKARGKASGAHPVATVVRTRNAQPQHWRDLVSSIRSGSTSASPHVAIGSNRVQWAVGHEWGSKGRYRQFPPATRVGRFLWSSAKEEEPRILDEMADVVGTALEGAYPD